MSLLDDARARAEARASGELPALDARPTMICVELGDGSSRYVARCCATPTPVAGPVKDKASGRKVKGVGQAFEGYSVTFACQSCATELAVLRWRT
jgi:hypothetical protein